MASNDENLCKICYDSKSSEENPLLSLCNCQGSLKYVHWNCSKKWLKNKIKIIEELRDIYLKCDLSDFRCEICGAFLKLTYEEQSRNFDMISILEKFKNYLVLRQDLVFTIFNLIKKKEIQFFKVVLSKCLDKKSSFCLSI